ncbi:MAG: hypothetical protein AAGG38_03740 [Planctomycetota bacterium]
MASDRPPPSKDPASLPVDPHEQESGEFSNFFNDVKAFTDRFGTPLLGIVAIFALAFAGYSFFTQRAESARQLAWIDLYASTSPDSLDLLAQSTRNPAVRAVAHLRAGDLLRQESLTASDQDATAILHTARDHYQAVLDDTPHPIYRLNARDGLGVVAEALREMDLAREHYEALEEEAGEAYPYWARLANQRLAMLPELAERITFAPEPVAPEPADASSVPGSDAAPEVDEPSDSPAESDTPDTAPAATSPDRPETPDAVETPETPEPPAPAE